VNDILTLIPGGVASTAGLRRSWTARRSHSPRTRARFFSVFKPFEEREPKGPGRPKTILATINQRLAGRSRTPSSSRSNRRRVNWANRRAAVAVFKMMLEDRANVGHCSPGGGPPAIYCRGRPNAESAPERRIHALFSGATPKTSYADPSIAWESGYAGCAARRRGGFEAMQVYLGSAYIKRLQITSGGPIRSLRRLTTAFFV